MSPAHRLIASKKLTKLDQKHKVSHNFSNVQCLNCHSQTHEHPFDVSDVKTKVNYQAKCISCHTADQSPEWYEKDAKGIAKSINKSYFAKKLKLVGCPEIEKN